MEIEAKFAVPDRDTFNRLQAVERLAGFVLAAGWIRQVHDTFLDTADRLILAAGYACRLRKQDKESLVTLKGLGGAQDAVHRRQELEVVVSSDQLPLQWPASPARDLVLQLIGPAPLVALFELQQTRLVRSITQGKRLVAELSLDQVHLKVGDRDQAYLELEVELKPEGNETDLTAIVVCLRDEWRLKPEPRSKFERALALVA